MAEPRSLAPPGPDALSGTDRAFVQKAIEGGHKEVALAKLARTRASDVRVKAYAARLERDHEKFGRELQQWSSGMTTSPSPTMANKDLTGLQGAAFDAAYIEAMIADHTEDIAAFEAQEKAGSIPDLTMFVQGALPTLKEHLKQAQDLRSTLGRAPTN